MEEIQATKRELRSDIATTLDQLSPEEKQEKHDLIGHRVFEFANFLEAKIVLFYVNTPHEVETRSIIERTFSLNKIVVLPAFDPETFSMTLLKVDNLNSDLLPDGPRGVVEPDPQRCKKVPIRYIDIALVPGIVFDEKGGRIGTGLGYYDRLIPKLPNTTRKVSLALEAQIVPQVPMESHDKFIDIIITENRTIYKI